MTYGDEINTLHVEREIVTKINEGKLLEKMNNNNNNNKAFVYSK